MARTNIVDRYGAPKRFIDLDERERHTKRIGWFIAEARLQAANRRMMAMCERAYDGDAIDPVKKREIEERGQTATNHNEIAPITDYLIGTERRMRIDFTVSPRESLAGPAIKDAQVKTKLLKWIADTNRAQYERSWAFGDALKAGMGWMEVAARGDDSDIPVLVGMVPWRQMLHDSLSNPKNDLTECRYVFRLKVVDLDIALAYFPDKAEQLLRVRQEASMAPAFSGLTVATGGMLDMGLVTGDEFGSQSYGLDYPAVDVFNPRERVLLIECWSLEPDWSHKGRSVGSMNSRVPLKMTFSIMTEFDTLIEAPSPYNHNRFPFVPIWMYRNRLTGLPYGPIKRLLDKQQAYDDVMNKAVWEASVNQIIMEEDAYDPEIMDVHEIADEIADAAGVVVLKKGGLNKFKDRRGIENAQAQLLLADRIKNSMQQSSSVTAENLGRHSAAESGIAIQNKAQMGDVLTAELFDNLLFAHQMEGELTLSVAEQFIVKPMVVAVKGERKQHEAVEINKPNPLFGQDGEPEYINDITKMRAQFVIGEQPWRATLGQAAFEQMMDLLGKMAPVAPQVVMAMLDLVFEYADIPNKDTVLQRIRSITGQPGPDGELTPQQQQAQQQQQQIGQAQFAAQLATLQAQVRKAQAEGEKLTADSLAKTLEALYMAAQAAQVITAAPQMTPVADELLKSAGFVDKNGSPTIVAPSGAAPAQPGVPQPGQGPLVGHEDGIETPAADGVRPGVPA